MFKDKCINAPVESTDDALKRGIRIVYHKHSVRGPRSVTPTKVDPSQINRDALPPELRKLLDSLKKDIK